ncbi:MULTISPECIES: hypothetical protein [Nocardia]|uniref:hypothetical protein n=1 Tax=Nocardia TaxID=1817 RepID=UPI002456BB35|nr:MULTISPECIES: hypothetical protein [Nocardia]
MRTKPFAELDRDDVGQMLIWRDKRGKKHRVNLVGLERKSSYVVAYVDSGRGTDQPLTLPNDTAVTLEP